MNIQKYLKEAEDRGISPYQVNYSLSTEMSVDVFNGEIETQQIGSSQDISAKGIFDGKQGSFATDAIDSLTPSLMAEKVLESARFGKEAKAEDYFKGGLRYKPCKKPKTPFIETNLKELRHFGLDLCKIVREKDSRLTQVTVSVSMLTSSTTKFNSLGLKCSEKGKAYFGSIEIVCENEQKEPRSSYCGFHSMVSLEDLKEQALKKIDEMISLAVDFFGSKALPTKKYKVVLSRSAVSSLLGTYLSQLNAKSVQKHLSVFEGKIDQQIMSKCLTMKNTPHVLSPYATSFDADGHPTTDFTFIDKGVLKTYFYSVETANVENKESNGCSNGNGNGSPTIVYIKPGKYSLDDLFAKAKNGLYITSVSGLNSGINGQTLDFSLPCEGYLIKDGKKDIAFSMMVVAGNLKDVFDSVLAVCNDQELDQHKFIPSMLVKSLTVSGK